MKSNTSRRLISGLLAASLAVVGAVPAAAADGVLDLSFGSGGSVVTDLGSTEDGRAVAIQPDGKIVLAGMGHAGTNTDFVLLRYLHDGTLDPAFGAGGKVYTDFGGNRFDYARAVAIQPDGRIIVAGQSAVSGNITDFALARYHPDGTLDTSFDGDGRVITHIGEIDDAESLALQIDGRIVVAGYSWNGSTDDFALARYNPDGSLDPSFGTDGTVLTNLGGVETDAAVAVQVDGRIVLAGTFVNPDVNISDFALVRYNHDGSLDPGFGQQGKVLTDFGGEDAVYDLALQADGRIVLVGTSDFRFAVARYDMDGSLDSAFDGDGKTTTDLGASNPPFDKHIAQAVAVQSDARIIVAGISNGDIGVVRYNTDGALDLSFGSNGKAIANLGGNDYGYDVAIQPDGRIVVGGSRDVDLMVTRFENGSASRPIDVILDIKPGRPENRIELEDDVCKDDDRLRVAVLTNADFDAATIDPSTLSLGDPALGGTTTPVRTRARDVDLDGDVDLLAVFDLCSLVSNDALAASSLELVLNGTTMAGVSITGRDFVHVVGDDDSGSSVPVFIYPVDGQTLDYEGAYLFKVRPVRGAQGYLWGFFQNGVMVWENYRDEGTLSGTEYGIHPGTTGHAAFVPGAVEVWVRGWVNGQWTDATVITIHLQPRTP